MAPALEPELSSIDRSWDTPAQPTRRPLSAMSVIDRSWSEPRGVPVVAPAALAAGTVVHAAARREDAAPPRFLGLPVGSPCAPSRAGVAGGRPNHDATALVDPLPAPRRPGRPDPSAPRNAVRPAVDLRRVARRRRRIAILAGAIAGAALACGVVLLSATADRPLTAARQALSSPRLPPQPPPQPPPSPSSVAAPKAAAVAAKRTTKPPALTRPAAQPVVAAAGKGPAVAAAGKGPAVAAAGKGPAVAAAGTRPAAPRAVKRLAAAPPATGKPATGKPATSKPATGKLATGKPATGKPATGKPATGKPAAGKPAADKPAARQRARRAGDQ